MRVISAGPMVNGEGKRHHLPVRGAGPTIDKCWWMAQGRTPQEEEEMRCLHVSIAAGHLVAHKTAFWIRNVTFVPIYLQQWSAGGSRWLWPASLKSRGKRLNLRPVLQPPPYTSPRASWIGDNVSYWRVKVCRVNQTVVDHNDGDVAPFCCYIYATQRKTIRFIHFAEY